jgi:hypothetical protein
MADYPDFYADGIGVSVSPFGLTVTFQLTQPSLEPGARVEASEIVGRVRMTPALAKVLAQGLNDALNQLANLQPPETKVQH